MDYDVVVIGAGFGGLAAALELSKQGARVGLFERLVYPGGCASTFRRGGWRFESGATLFAGLDTGQLFGDWIAEFDMPVTVDWLDPVVEMRTDRFQLDVPPRRADFGERLGRLAGAQSSLPAFLGHQKAVADALWRLFEDPSLLPPLTFSDVIGHLRHAADYLPIVPLMGRPLLDVLGDHGLAEGTVRDYFDAVCQITVQTDAAHAEAPFALAATDYFFRGAGHIHGGIGRLAWAMSDTIEALGGRVHYAEAVHQLRPTRDGWTVSTRHRNVTAPNVVANLLPAALADMLDASARAPALGKLSKRVRKGWGAAMLYLGVDADADLPASASHLELVSDSDQPFIGGNHVFCSVSAANETDRGPDGSRTVTCSTHVDMAALLGRSADERGAYIDGIHAQMRRTIAQRAPEVADAVVEEMTASPRTFARFTGRPDGFVGGVPRTAGLWNYRSLMPPRIQPGLYMVGDSTFPGQSTLACAIGGKQVAARIAGAPG